MSANFDDCLAVVLRMEGGYSNNRYDIGGETNLGVTRRVWDDWLGRRGSDMHQLKPKDVAPLYKARYWNPVCGDYLPASIALCVFDCAVNMGVLRAGKILQQIVGVPVDGIVGTKTVTAVDGFVNDHGEAQLVRQFQNARRDYYRALGTFSTFGKGWLRRCDTIETQALKVCP